MQIETLYGRQPVYEALRAGRRRLQRLLVAEGVRRRDLVLEILTLAERRHIPVKEVARAALASAAGGDVNDQGVALEAGPYPYASLDDALAAARDAGEPPFLLLLDHVEDPQNLGALLRTADASGVHGVLIPDRRAATVSPAAARASAGAAEHLHVVLVGNLVNAMNELKAQGIWIAGLDATPGAVPYTEARLDGPIAVVVGSEGQGLGRLVGETCDFLMRIPMCGRVASLNASAAGALALYEVRRRRPAHPPV